MKRRNYMVQFIDGTGMVNILIMSNRTGFKSKLVLLVSMTLCQTEPGLN